MKPITRTTEGKGVEALGAVTPRVHTLHLISKDRAVTSINALKEKGNFFHLKPECYSENAMSPFGAGSNFP